MAMPRLITPEWLDTLPPDNARAITSRRDLRRINSIMGHARFFPRVLSRRFLQKPPKRLVEIGSGDGTFLLTVAREMAAQWPGVKVTLVDLHPVVTADTAMAFQALGWEARVETTDVFAWADCLEPTDIVLANLFLHHFSNESLTGLFRRIASRTRVFAACEPRRSGAALAASRLLGLIGCNDVTRHDGPVSVRAGFSGTELSSLWPSREGWVLDEGKDGWFSHGFVAARAQGPA